MKLRNILLALCLVMFINSNSQEIEDNPYVAEWNNGFKFVTSDGNFKLGFGGRLMFDSGFFSINDEAESNGFLLLNENGHEIRRARFFTAGTIYHNIDFKLQVEYSGNKTSIKDAFITIKDIPYVGNFIVGRFIEPFQLETITSSKYITFMERGLPNSFFLDRNTGAMLFNQVFDKKMSWQVGVYRGINNHDIENIAANGDYAVTGRLAATVIENENILLHVGAAHSYRKPKENRTLRYSIRPESHMAEKYLKIQLDEVENINMSNIETALIAGSFSFQGEYLLARVNSSIENEDFNSYYTQVSYFLTGEKRAYKNSLTGFGRIKPKENFGKNGKGAFEVALRYSYVDGMGSDSMKNITAGINWYLNPVTRVMANYIISNIDNQTQFNGMGRFSAFQFRFQVDF